MPTKQRSGIGDQLKECGPSRRSDLYRWLQSHYNELAPGLNATAPQWGKAAVLVAGKGVLGANGKPASANSLRQMWLRVTKDRDAEREAKAAARSRKTIANHSPRKNDWRPPVAEPKSDLRNFTTETQQRARQAAVLFREEPMPSRVARPAPIQNKEVDDDDLTPEQQAKIDRVKEEFRQAALRRSGNLY